VKKERDEVQVTVEVLDKKVELLEQSLEEARANAKWSWRRRMKRAAEG